MEMMAGINAVQITDSSIWWKRKKKKPNQKTTIGSVPDEIFQVFLLTDLIILYKMIKLAKNPSV